jgi:hypothetical protein
MAMCEQREQLLDYLYDEATPASRREIERHVEGCHECRDELRAFRDVRQDLLAWDVPNPPSIWKAFAPAAPVPWHRQVPAWALAAAASLMLLVGSAGGFVAHNVLDAKGAAAGQPTGAAGSPQLIQASVDSKAILSLIREELAKGNGDLTGRVIPVNNTPAHGYQLDAKTEERLMTRVEAWVNERQMQQAVRITDILMTRWEEDGRLRKENGQAFTRLSAQIDQLEAQVKQLAAAQTAKGQ